MGSGRAQRWQDLLLSIGSHLLANQVIAGVAIDGIERDHVLTAQGRNGTVQRSFDIFPLTDFASYSAVNSFIWRASHILQRLANPLLRDDIEVRRLL